MYFLLQVYELMWHLVHPHLFCLEPSGLRYGMHTVCKLSRNSATKRFLLSRTAACTGYSTNLPHQWLFESKYFLRFDQENCAVDQKKTGTVQRNRNEFIRVFFRPLCNYRPSIYSLQFTGLVNPNVLRYSTCRAGIDAG